jgi:transcription elongation factor Elf1
MFAELASTENVSLWGVRVRTELPWRPDSRIFVKSSKGDVWMRARVAYCETLQGKDHALGLEFYGTAHRYNLTFRCVHCGRYEASANFRSDQVEREERIKARIYRVQCSGCGWRGEACGVSAVRILRYQSKEMYSAEEKALLAQWPPKQWPAKPARGESKRGMSLGLP